MFDLRSHLLWVVTPLTLIVAVFAGITSGTAEVSARSTAPAPPRSGSQASAPRPQPYAVAGRVVFVDLPSRMLLVQRLDGHFIDVYLTPRTVIRQNGKAIRPRDLGAGDRVVIVGKPHTKFGIDAGVVVVAARGAAANAPPR